MSSCRYPMMGRLFVLYVFVKAKIEIPRSPIHPTRPPSPFLICMNMHRYPAASLSRKSTASRLLVARPSSASAEFPSVPSILRSMAVMAVMGRFCVQLILYKRFACAKIAENLAESAFSGLFKREICAKSGGSYLHNDVFLQSCAAE